MMFTLTEFLFNLKFNYRGIIKTFNMIIIKTLNIARDNGGTIKFG